MENLAWFSHVGTEYEVKDEENKKIVEFEGPKVFNWDNCTIRISKSPFKKFRLFVRGHQHKYSKHNKKIIRPTFLLIVDIDSIGSIYEEPYHIGSDRKDLKSIQWKTYPRYVFRLDNYWIWEWKKKYTDIKQSNVYSIHEQIKTFLEGRSNHEEYDNIIVEALPHDEIRGVLPVVYQPAIDKLENYVCQIHSSKDEVNKHIIEVSILFNNEQLRRHQAVNTLYEKFRLFFYGRKIDVESFRIHLPTESFSDNYFTFQGIYSGDFGIFEDSIHGDIKTPPPRRIILSYFMDHYHPVVFINTSNHAMAQMDNNPTFWKWEYQPFEEKSPVIIGTKSREQINNEFISVFDRFFRLKGTLNYQLAGSQKAVRLENY
jgi:hypothetical protein